MISEKEVLELMRAGKSPEEIGAEIANIMNAAIAAKAKEDEAKRKAEEEKAWQLKDAEVVAEVLNEYLKKYCGGSGSDITGEALVQSSDILTKMIKVVDKVEDGVKATVRQTTKEPGKPAKTVVKTGQEAEDWIEEVFGDFFKAFGL